MRMCHEIWVTNWKKRKPCASTSGGQRPGWSSFAPRWLGAIRIRIKTFRTARVGSTLDHQIGSRAINTVCCRQSHRRVAVLKASCFQCLSEKRHRKFGESVA